MFSLKYTLLTTIGTVTIIGCTSLRHVGEVRHTDNQSGISSSDTSWHIAPQQVEDLPLLEPDPPPFWAGKPTLKLKPYIPGRDDGSLYGSDDIIGQIKKIVGYRVQLFAGREQDRALNIKAAAKSHFGVPVYLVYEAPQYKVRAGNFINRTQAAELLSHIKMDGYRDAWIVRSKVEIER